MKKGKPFDELKREHDAKLRKPTPSPPRQPANGSVRHLKPLGWHDLGNVNAQQQAIDGLIGENQLVMMYGESGSGKSFLAFDCVAHYALRREWMGHRVKGGGVLYIAAEGRGGWTNRVQAFCQHHAIDDEQRAMVPFGFILESINLGRNGGGDVAAVIRAADEAARLWDQPVGMIVTDTMARATPGANENDPVDVGAFVANLDAIRDHTKATQLIVHHSGKNSALGARGHSSLRAAVDGELEVERTNGSRLLRVRKSRDGNDGLEQAFTLLSVDIGQDQDGQPITSCVVEPAAIEEHQKAKATKIPKWRQSLDVLDNTLVDYPTTSPNASKFPTTRTLTKLSHFKDALERKFIIDTEAKPSTQRGQWRDALKGLKDNGHADFDLKADVIWRIDVG